MYSIEQHRQRRARFYGAIPDFWADLYGAEYALLDYHMLTEEEAEQIRTATSRIGHLYRKTAKLLRQLPDETLRLLGFHREALPFLRIPVLPAETVIARADLVHVGGTFKLIELNADTPTFIRETFDINERAASFFHLRSPNKGEVRYVSEAVQHAILQSYRLLHRDGEPYVVFTSHEDHMEDRETVRYLQRISGMEAAYVSLHELYVVAEDVPLRGGGVLRRGLYDGEGRRIDVLYRQTYPLEHLVEDRSPDGTKVGIQLLELWKEREVALINPPSAFLLQSKAVQALIWGLYEEGNPFFTDEERQWISEHFLPTYLDEEYFLDQQLMYVQKPAFGREGDTVVIKNGKGEPIVADIQQTYKDETPVYQQYVPLPETVVKTINGCETVRLLHTCFLINGKAMGIGLRAGGMITNNLSYYLPVMMKG
ncbi:glutathionylspermidine synthase family protein [Parageobacillus thermoglucosidasius]|uniref:Glutathionylspermidine synthase n=1 Tax=Parageobacillus thermoglucosidasius TaxID=1426 RepID=A0A1B7KSB2_PARTM|nr:glutathionylspermidine synthase family protein [Parageobacillus thermoglucosidasius]OAT72889.1 glutathionylspermidine synthase [Parageobacillus thermoglucosidasius]